MSEKIAGQGAIEKLSALVKAALAGKQDTITASTSLTAKTVNAGLIYTTTAPTAANNDGLKIAYLTSEPSTKYDGWLYLIKE